MAEKHYIIKCEHLEEDKGKPTEKRCPNHSDCAIHCHENKTERCRAHCGRSWKTTTEEQANAIKYLHMAEQALHKPVIEKI